MSHLEKILDKAFGKDKEELHPPRAPIISEKSVEDISDREKDSPQQFDSKPIIDFSYLTSNSSFQRAIMEFIKKFVPGFEKVSPRGSKEEMVKSFDSNAQNYGNVIKEFTEKLAKVKKSERSSNNSIL